MLSEPPPAEAAPEAEENYYVFTAGGHRLALPLSPVERVVRAVYITPVPHPPYGTPGVIDVQGEAVPVIGLHLWMAGAPAAAAGPVQPDPEHHFILIRRAGQRLALWAESVEGVIRQPEIRTHVHAPRESGAATEEGWSFIMTPEGLVPLCDLDRLFRSIHAEIEWLLHALEAGAGTPDTASDEEEG